MLLPRRWVVERSFGWTARFRRLARDYERLTETLKGLHYVAFVFQMPHKAVPQFWWSFIARSNRKMLQRWAERW